jgi:hypothetical protein
MWDMIYHAIASFVACMAFYFYAKRKETGIYQLSILSKKQVAYFTALSGTGLPLGTPMEELNKPDLGE